MVEESSPTGDLMDEIRMLRRRVEALESAREIDIEVFDTLERREELEHSFGQRLTSLVEITNELAMTESLDDLCRRTVELSRDRLQFQCIGIWFQAEQPDVILGSYGVDDAGCVVDERGMRHRVRRDTPEGRVLLSHEPLVLESHAEMRDESGEVYGYGAKVIAAIWNGHQVIGLISMDNRISRKRISWYDCELMRLLGSAMGALYARKKAEIKQGQLIGELRHALDKIKTLQGMLPICSSCKKIRNDRGYWEQIETYISEHSDASFSHGICPDCAHELYPQIYGPAPVSEESAD